MKRLFDLVCVFFATIVFSPFFVAVYIAIKLEDGTWYGTWTMGDKYVSVGFSKQNDSYSTLDIAHARVKEYTLDTLYEDGLTAIVASTGDEPILKKKEIRKTVII